MAFVNKKEHSNSEARILELFQSRAELKQEFTELQKQNERLRKLSAKKTRRIEYLESDIQTLEKHLTNPEFFADVRVYYQLRRIWNTCHSYIHKFRDRLVDQQRDSERKSQLAEFNQQQANKLDALNALITSQTDLLEDMRKRGGIIVAKIAASKYPWQYFSKRSLSRQKMLLQDEYKATHAQLQTLSEERTTIESEPWPEFDNLDLAAKRSINLAMIALAQFFYTALSGQSLHNKAFKVQKARPWEISYGESAAQARLAAECDKKLKLFSQLKDLGSEIQTRMASLSEGIAYTSETDTIPDYESVLSISSVGSGSSLPDSSGSTGMDEFTISFPDDIADNIADKGEKKSLEVNVLKVNFWDLQELMIP